MGIMNDTLKHGVVGEATHAAAGAFTTVAKVTEADEANNLCSIQYYNKDSELQKKDSVAVDLRNKDWFPEKGDIVLVKINGNTAIVEQQYTEDYSRDIGGKKQLKNDIHADSDGTCGGQIF